MLTVKLRPTDWNAMAGQKVNKQILKSIIRNPEESPKTLIFEGDYGCGKTTSARIMARELNGIKDPNFDLNNCPFYYEYDSTVIGNVDKIRELRDVFGTGSKDYWIVIVFDECHVVSQSAQTALLKIVEEVKGRVFFIFCTTHVHKVLPTIRSRSMELKFGTVSVEEVVEHLTIVQNELGVNVPDDIKYVIAARSGGHMRNVHMLLDKFLLIGEDVFKQTVKSSTALYCKYFYACRTSNDKDVLDSLESLMDFPMEDLKTDFAQLILSCMKAYNNLGSVNPSVDTLVKSYGADVMKLVKNYYSDWARNIFRSDADFKAGMLCFYTLLKSEGTTSTTTTTNNQANNSLQNKAMVRR